MFSMLNAQEIALEQAKVKVQIDLDKCRKEKEKLFFHASTVSYLAFFKKHLGYEVRDFNADLCTLRIACMGEVVTVSKRTCSFTVTIGSGVSGNIPGGAIPEIPALLSKEKQKETVCDFRKSPSGAISRNPS